MYQTEPPAAYWRDQLIQWGPRVVFAILILIATHFVAKAVQWAIAKLIDRMPVLKRHPQAGVDSVGTELDSRGDGGHRPRRPAGPRPVPRREGRL